MNLIMRMLLNLFLLLASSQDNQPALLWHFEGSFFKREGRKEGQWPLGLAHVREM